jgi:hypothetical protein
MIEPATPQEPEGIRSATIWAVGIGLVAISAMLTLIAWWLVAAPPASERAAKESPLKRDQFEVANGGAEVHAAGEQRLRRTEWVDRKAGVVRIPIDRAIDAVAADPRLIGAGPGTSPGPISGSVPGAAAAGPIAGQVRR